MAVLGQWHGFQSIAHNIPQPDARWREFIQRFVSTKFCQTGQYIHVRSAHVLCAVSWIATHRENGFNLQTSRRMRQKCQYMISCMTYDFSLSGKLAQVLSASLAVSAVMQIFVLFLGSKTCNMSQ